MMKLFTIIIATRNRPILFERALNSVATQCCQSFDIIIVDDGSLPEHREAYDQAVAKIQAKFGGTIRHEHLIRRDNGHGHAYALNHGVQRATTAYVGFLDDDDNWVDHGYLCRVEAAIRHVEAANGKLLDLHMGNQKALENGKLLDRKIWLGGLEAELKKTGRIPAIANSYQITVDDLMKASGFCHVNCLIVRRELWTKIGGMDEQNRWECDRDLFLRLIDAAVEIMFDPHIVSHHNIPDPNKTQNATTAMPELDKRLSQLRVVDRASLHATNKAIRAYGHRHKGYTLKKIAEALAGMGRYRDAAIYARQALGALPTIKWGIFTAWLSLRAIFAKE